jgi:molybdopterin molybdotransferase
MLTYAEALELVLGRVAPLAPRRVPLPEALGLVAAEDFVAAEALPPFANSAMDGFALRALDSLPARPGSPVRLRVAGVVPAGQGVVPVLEPGSALRIMTGAALPAGADTVVPLERVKASGDWVEIERPLPEGASVRFAGEDYPAGGRVVDAGTTLRPAEIGVLAAIGRTEVRVHPRPRVAVLTTGNELVDAASRPGPGQIRDANIHSLCAQATACGALAVPFPRVADTREGVEGALLRAMEAADVVLTNGGVSVGDFDYVKAVLQDLGAEQVFWRVAQKPGGPMGLWLLQGKPVFGIPGNPVAAMLIFEEYVRPALRRMLGCRFLHRPCRPGFLDASWSKGVPDGKCHFLRVVATGPAVALTGPPGSGILSSMVKANALALIPEATLSLPAGGEVLLHLIDEREDH